MSEAAYEKDREARAHWIQALQAKAALADQLAEAVLHCIASDRSHRWFCNEDNIDKVYALARKVKGGSDGHQADPRTD